MVRIKFIYVYMINLFGLNKEVKRINNKDYNKETITGIQQNFTGRENLNPSG